MSSNDRKPTRDPVVKALWANCGGRCAICRKPIIQSTNSQANIPIGEEAHICDVKPKTKRYNSRLSDEEKRSYSNLIILCADCHKIIDNDDVTYTVEELLRLKAVQEREARELLGIELANVTFHELEIITRHLVATPTYDKDYKLVPPLEKIKKNNLSVVVGNHITSGLMQSKLVSDFLLNNVEIEFADKLKAGFVNKYLEKKGQGFLGDDLFYELWEFARNGSNDQKLYAAGLAVITYFFEQCEVFEK